MELFSRCFCALVEDWVKAGETTLYELPAVALRDRLELTERPNRMHAPYLAVRRPGGGPNGGAGSRAPAVRSNGKVTTYGELKKRSDALAGQLQRAGVRKKGDFIALSGRRDADLVAGMLGILKAGCAYVPVLSSFPEARLRYMLEISGAKLLLCDPCTYPELPENLSCPKVVMKGGGYPVYAGRGRSVRDDIHILFTSGTTGQPMARFCPTGRL